MAGKRSAFAGEGRTLGKLRNSVTGMGARWRCPTCKFLSSTDHEKCSKCGDDQPRNVRQSNRKLERGSGDVVRPRVQRGSGSLMRSTGGAHARKGSGRIGRTAAAPRAKKTLASTTGGRKSSTPSTRSSAKTRRGPNGVGTVRKATKTFRSAGGPGQFSNKAHVMGIKGTVARGAMARTNRRGGAAGRANGGLGDRAQVVGLKTMAARRRKDKTTDGLAASRAARESRGGLSNKARVHSVGNLAPQAGKRVTRSSRLGFSKQGSGRWARKKGNTAVKSFERGGRTVRKRVPVSNGTQGWSGTFPATSAGPQKPKPMLSRQARQKETHIRNGVLPEKKRASRLTGGFATLSDLNKNRPAPSQKPAFGSGSNIHGFGGSSENTKPSGNRLTGIHTINNFGGKASLEQTTGPATRGSNMSTESTARFVDMLQAAASHSGPNVMPCMRKQTEGKVGARIGPRKVAIDNGAGYSKYEL